MTQAKKSAQLSAEQTEDTLVFTNKIPTHWEEVFFSAILLIIWGIVGYFVWEYFFKELLLEPESDIIIYSNPDNTFIDNVFFFLAPFMLWAFFGIAHFKTILWQLVGIETIKITKGSICISERILKFKEEKRYSADQINNFHIGPQSIYIPRRYTKIRPGTVMFDYARKTRVNFGYDVSKGHARKILYLIQAKFPTYEGLYDKEVKKQRKRWSWIAGALIVAPFCLFFAFALYQFIVWGPIAKKIKVPLQSEFELIAHCQTRNP